MHTEGLTVLSNNTKATLASGDLPAAQLLRASPGVVGLATLQHCASIHRMATLPQAGVLLGSRGTAPAAQAHRTTQTWSLLKDRKKKNTTEDVRGQVKQACCVPNARIPKCVSVVEQVK